MRLVKFKFLDYKSIQSISPCWTARDITIFAGKNESGKTSSLEAIRDFDKEIDTLPLESLSIEQTAQPFLELWFMPSSQIWVEIWKLLNTTPNKEIENYKDKNGIPLYKTYEGNYYLGDDFVDLLNNVLEQRRSDTWNRIMTQLYSDPTPHMSKFLPEVNNIEDIDRLYEIVQKILHVEKRTNEEKQLLNNLSQGERDHFRAIKDNLEYIKNITDYDGLINILTSHLPKFIFFSSFDQTLPYEIPIAEIEKHQSVIDFLKVADINISELRETTDEQKRTNLLKGKSAKINGEFSEFWSQESIELYAKVSGEKLYICIGEKDTNKDLEFRPNQRSKGFQWYLSFYLRLKAESTNGTDKNMVILIDEPGLYLHAKAQEDVLKVLESLCNDNIQIIFSTHSPYLLDMKRFDRIKLVNRCKKNGTKISNKVHVGADRDALTPIVTALGIDITKQANLIGKTNVILEGISDYYILLAMAQALGLQETIKKISFIPCKGSSQMHLMASILIGWGQEFVAVVDNDSAGQSAKKDLLDLNLEEKSIILTCETNNFAIEDLFSKEDFIKYVACKNYKADEKTSNSQRVKDNSDKVIMSKLLLDKIKSEQKITFSNETKDNFSELFRKIAITLNILDDLPAVANDALKKSG